MNSEAKSLKLEIWTVEFRNPSLTNLLRHVATGVGVEVGGLSLDLRDLASKLRLELVRARDACAGGQLGRGGAWWWQRRWEVGGGRWEVGGG